MIRLWFIIAAFLLIPAGAAAGNADAEIEDLLDAIGDSGCVFIRNGSRHDAEKAEAHLRMKYRRARRYAKTPELFIERLASKSSMSRKPYFIECPGEEPIPSRDWLLARLDDIREQTP